MFSSNFLDPAASAKEERDNFLEDLVFSKVRKMPDSSIRMHWAAATSVPTAPTACAPECDGSRCPSCPADTGWSGVCWCVWCGVCGLGGSYVAYLEPAAARFMLDVHLFVFKNEDRVRINPKSIRIHV